MSKYDAVLKMPPTNMGGKRRNDALSVEMKKRWVLFKIREYNR